MKALLKGTHPSSRGLGQFDFGIVTGFSEQVDAEEFVGVDAHRRFVRAGINAARLHLFAAAVVKITNGGLAGLLGLACYGINLKRGDGENISVRAALAIFVTVMIFAKTISTSDAMVINDDGQAALGSAVNGVNRAIAQAFGIVATAAGSGNQIIIESQSIPDHAGNAVMRLRAGADTFITSRAAVEVDQQKALSLE
jgi:hypothetical protein